MATQRCDESRMVLIFFCERDSTAVPCAALARLTSFFPVIDPSRSSLASRRGPFLEQVGWMR